MHCFALAVLPHHHKQAWTSHPRKGFHHRLDHVERTAQVLPATLEDCPAALQASRYLQKAMHQLRTMQERAMRMVQVVLSAMAMIDETVVTKLWKKAQGEVETVVQELAT